MQLPKGKFIICLLVLVMATLSCRCVPWDQLPDGFPGTTTIENQALVDEAAAQVETQNEQSQIEVPLTSSELPITTMYQGGTTIGSTWEVTWGGQIIVDEITLFVDDEGNVNGILLSIWESGKSTPIDGCSSESIRTVTGELSGRLTATNHNIQIEFTHHHEILRSGCPEGNETIVESWISTADVQISGDKIKGSTEDSFMFEATKQ